MLEYWPALPALVRRLIMSYQASNPGLGQGILEYWNVDSKRKFLIF